MWLESYVTLFLYLFKIHTEINFVDTIRKNYEWLKIFIVMMTELLKTFFVFSFYNLFYVFTFKHFVCWNGNPWYFLILNIFFQEFFTSRQDRKQALSEQSFSINWTCRKFCVWLDGKCERKCCGKFPPPFLRERKAFHSVLHRWKSERGLCWNCLYV